MEKLKKKGWTNEEISRLSVVWKKLDKKRRHHKLLDNIVYLFIILFTIAATLVLAYAYIPFVLVLRGILPYFLMGLAGFVFGSMFSIMIHDVEHIRGHKHTLYLILLVAATLYNFSTVFSEVNGLSKSLGWGSENIIALSASYITLFIIPYYYFWKHG